MFSFEIFIFFVLMCVTFASQYGKLYVEAFLRSGMPVLDNLFRQRKVRLCL